MSSIEGKDKESVLMRECINVLMVECVSAFRTSCPVLKELVRSLIGSVLLSQKGWVAFLFVVPLSS